MGLGSVLLLVVLAIVVAHGILVYNGLVGVKNAVAKAWANIDVLLKQRHDELPNLVATCRQYAQFERQTLEKVVQARQLVQAARERADVVALGPAEAGLRTAVSTVFALVESYPELKANRNFIQLQSRITELENAIADRREFYNDSATTNNVRIEQFPDALIAGLFNFREAKLLNFEASETAYVEVKNLFV